MKTESFKVFTEKTIVLEQETHTYRLLADPGRTFTSCTTFIDSFFEPFDAETVAARLVETHPKYKAYTLESLLAEWKAAADAGTQVHAAIEQGLLTDTTPRSGKALRAFEWIAEYLPRSRYTLHPEVIVYSERFGLAGTLDLLVFDRKNEIYLLIDWKTNKKITSTSFGNKHGIVGPALELDDCHAVRYGLQLSLYHYILEVEYGISPRKQALVHLTDWDATPITCRYDRETIVRMLEYAAVQAAV